MATVSRAKVCAECGHRAGRHSKGWGCNVVGCDRVEQPPFSSGDPSTRPAPTAGER